MEKMAQGETTIPAVCGRDEALAKATALSIEAEKMICDGDYDTAITLSGMALGEIADG